MIKATLANGRHTLEAVDDLSRIGALLDQPKNSIWLDVDRPTEDDLNFLRKVFGFHELAIEDVMRAHQRPKLDDYEGYSFIVLYAARRPAEGRLTLAEIDAFLGQNYLVTVHREPLGLLTEVVTRWQRNRLVLDGSALSMLYSLLDTIVDEYFPVVDSIAEDVEGLEEAIFAGSSPETLHRIFRLKKDLLAMRRVVAPEREVIALLLRRDLPPFDRKVLPYFQDVFDHIIRVVDSIDLYQDLLTGSLDAHLSTVSNSLNSVMKRLTAITVILMIPALIASVYGMNFVNMPELHWVYGYPAALTLMAGVALGLAIYFWRIDWL